jgi:hypothetical protein
MSAIWKLTSQQPLIGAKRNGHPANNDGTKRNQLMVAFNNYYTLNNSTSLSEKNH